MFTIDLVKQKSSKTTNLRKEKVFYPKDELKLYKGFNIVDMDISYNGHIHAIVENNNNSIYCNMTHSTLFTVPTDKKLTALKISNQISNQLLALADTKDNNNHRIYFHYVDKIQRNQFNTGSFYEILNVPSPVDMLKFNHNDNFLSVVLRDQSICLYKLYFDKKVKQNAIVHTLYIFDNLKSVSCEFVLYHGAEFLVFGLNTINFWDINENKWIVNKRRIYGWNESEYMKSIVFDNRKRILILSNQGKVTQLHTYRSWSDFSADNMEEEENHRAFQGFNYAAFSSKEPYKGKEFDNCRKYFVTVTSGGYIHVWDFHFYNGGYSGEDLKFDSGVKNIKKILFHPVKNILFLIGVDYYKTIDIDYRRALNHYPRLSDINMLATKDKYIDHVSFQKLTFTKSEYTIYLYCACVLKGIRGQRDMALTFNKHGFTSIKIKDNMQEIINMVGASDEEHFEDMVDLKYEDVKICLPELGTELLKGVEKLQLHSFYLEKIVNMILNGSIKFITYDDVNTIPAKRKKTELVGTVSLRF